MKGYVILSKLYSIRAYENVMNDTKKWLNDFKESTYYQELSESEKKQAQTIVEMFTELHYNHEIRKPREWTRNSVEDIITGPLVEKEGVSQVFLKQTQLVLTQYFLFLNGLGKIKNARVLINTINELIPMMINFGEFVLESTNSPIGIDGPLGYEMEGLDEFEVFIRLENPVDNT